MITFFITIFFLGGGLLESLPTQGSDPTPYPKLTHILNERKIADTG